MKSFIDLIKKEVINESSLFYSDKKLLNKQFIYNNDIYKCIEANRTPSDLLFVLKNDTNIHAFLNPDFSEITEFSPLDFLGRKLNNCGEREVESAIYKILDAKRLKSRYNAKMPSGYTYAIAISQPMCPDYRVSPHIIDGLKNNINTSGNCLVKDIGAVFDEYKNIVSKYTYKKLDIELPEYTPCNNDGQRYANFILFSLK